MPKENAEYWRPKLGRNLGRDQEVQEALIALGWAVIIVWECEIRRVEFLADLISRIVSFPILTRGPTRS